MSYKSKILTPPGELIDFNGRNVHVQRKGKGSPTVVFESGIFGDSFDFFKVQPEISKITSTLSYDRAGHGYSDPSSNPERVGAVIAEELFDLLETLKIIEPVVLVGWSAGGLYIREFTFQHPERVAGMVLIDSAIKGFQNHLPEDLALIIQHNRNNTADLLSRFSKMKKEEILEEFGNNPPWQNLHPDTHKYIEDVVSPEESKFFFQIFSSFREEEKDKSKYKKSLNDIPLKVIYAIAEESPHFNKEQNSKYNKIKADLSRELSELSTKGRSVEVVSDHNIANEKPEIVIEAIVDIVNQVRSA
jgi:pimeloyl-ACP methyl ester carboxylesterase